MNDMPTNDPVTRPENTLLKEAMALDPSTGPWKVDDMENIGENWLIGFGQSYEGREVIITTDAVHASEFDGDAYTDAEFIVWCRNNWEAILRALAS